VPISLINSPPERGEVWFTLSGNPKTVTRESKKRWLFWTT